MENQETQEIKPETNKKKILAISFLTLGISILLISLLGKKKEEKTPIVINVNNGDKPKTKNKRKTKNDKPKEIEKEVNQSDNSDDDNETNDEFLDELPDDDNTDDKNKE